MARDRPRRRVLVTGWFSFLHGEATAGDLEAGAAVAGWLHDAGVAHEVAWSPVLAPTRSGPTLDEVDPAGFTDLVFVCGPLAGWQVEQLCDRFAACRRTAIGVSLVEGGSAHRFDAVFPRDDRRGPGPPDQRPDLSLARPPQPWPLVALVRANEQPEYGERARHAEVHALVDEALGTGAWSVVEVDTRVDPRAPRQRHPGQIDGVLAAASLVITTRLHGLVLALRAGTPAVAIDPIDGGAKVTAQARALHWPAALAAGALDSEAVTAAMAWCVGPEAAGALRHSAARAAAGTAAARASLLAAVAAP